MRQCPFCGCSTVTVISYQNNRRVLCSHCGAVGPVGKDEAEATLLWNGHEWTAFADGTRVPGPSELKKGES